MFVLCLFLSLFILGNFIVLITHISGNRWRCCCCCCHAFMPVNVHFNRPSINYAYVFPYLSVNIGSTYLLTGGPLIKLKEKLCPSCIAPKTKKQNEFLFLFKVCLKKWIFAKWKSQAKVLNVRCGTAVYFLFVSCGHRIISVQKLLYTMCLNWVLKRIWTICFGTFTEIAETRPDDLVLSGPWLKPVMFMTESSEFLFSHWTTHETQQFVIYEFQLEIKCDCTKQEPKILIDKQIWQRCEKTGNFSRILPQMVSLLVWCQLTATADMTIVFCTSTTLASQTNNILILVVLYCNVEVAIHYSFRLFLQTFS